MSLELQLFDKSLISYHNEVNASVITRTKVEIQKEARKLPVGYYIKHILSQAVIQNRQM